VTGGQIPSEFYLQLARAPSSHLKGLMLSADRPSIPALVGHDHRGYNQRRVLSLVGARTFIKGFAIADGRAEGWNLRVKQNGLRGPWRPVPHARRYGHFTATYVDPTSADRVYLHAVLLNYAAGRGRRLSPLRLLRDYVVNVRSGSNEVLVGRAYLALLRWRIPLGFFLLERQ
jgi:hypothetical protein